MIIIYENQSYAKFFYHTTFSPPHRCSHHHKMAEILPDRYHTSFWFIWKSIEIYCLPLHGRGIIATIASSFYLFVFSSNKFTNSRLFRQKFRDNSFSLLAVEFFIVLYKVKISSTRGNRISNRLTLKPKAGKVSQIPSWHWKQNHHVQLVPLQLGLQNDFSELRF